MSLSKDRTYKRVLRGEGPNPENPRNVPSLKIGNLQTSGLKGGGEKVKKTLKECSGFKVKGPSK